MILCYEVFCLVKGVKRCAVSCCENEASFIAVGNYYPGRVRGGKYYVKCS